MMLELLFAMKHIKMTSWRIKVNFPSHSYRVGMSFKGAGIIAVITSTINAHRCSEMQDNFLIPSIKIGLVMYKSFLG